MSATEEDTELRDLLIQNLENNGVLNKIKAELRAAVFLALEEQDKVENKTPLVNENLRKCLSTKDGNLITDFLQVFNLDFTLAVFQPEINTVNGLDTRESLSKELGFSEYEGKKSTPLLLEFIKRSRNNDKFSIFSEADRASHIPKELSPRQIAEAQKKFDCRCKDPSGGLGKDDVIGIFSELLPNFSRSMLEQFVTDELAAKDLNNSVDFQEFLGLFKQLHFQCRSVIPRYKGFIKASAAQEEPPGPQAGDPPSHSEPLISQKNKVLLASEGFIPSRNDPTVLRRPLDLGLDDDDDDDDDEGDSFFDDPLPKPQKTYGCSLSSTDKPYTGQRLSEKSFSQKVIQHPQREESLAGPSFSKMRRGTSLNDLSAIGSDTEGDGEDMFSDAENKASTNPEPRRLGSTKAPGITSSHLSDTPPLKSTENNQKDPVSSKNESKEKSLQDVKMLKEKTGSALPADEELDYDDDFNSHNSKSEVSISEEIEEASLEGPDLSDRLEEITQDVSVSQTSQAADYMEDVDGQADNT
ncbi:FGFR1 oncogene partner isoform X2 [Silurus meridionalis]|nr:FGFR1 oncogene partner isoform X2 [Silurus meridionalis]